MRCDTRVGVTGLGVVCALGKGVDEFWSSLLAGCFGVGPITRFDASTYACRVAGEAGELSLSPRFLQQWSRFDRVSQLALVASAEAMSEASLSCGQLQQERIGVFVGTGIGGVETHETEVEKLVRISTHRVHPTTILRSMCNAPAALIAAEYGIAGPSETVVGACASGLQAVGSAYRAIQMGLVDVAIAGGTEAPLSRPLYAAWNAMRVLSRWQGEPGGACRPFSGDRSGTVLAEGAAFLVLESVDHAKKRGVPVRAVLSGYGATTTFEHPTTPSVSRQAAAMNAALREGAIPSGEVAYIHAHASSTPANDRAETASIKAVLGEDAYRVPISSGKGHYGHALGASGTIGCVTAVLALEYCQAPPTLNLAQADPECDLDYVPHQPKPLRHGYAAVVNAFGFGGNNVSLVLSAA